MKTLVKNYLFSASNKQITISNVLNIELEELLLITNVKDNIIIYNFADPSLGATVSGNVITLNYDTNMQDSDELQIFIDLPNYEDLYNLSKVMISGFSSVVSELHAMRTAQGLPDSTGRVRSSVVLESGTVSTVTTLSNLNGIGGYSPQLIAMSDMNTGANFLRNMIKIYGGNI